MNLNQLVVLRRGAIPFLVAAALGCHSDPATIPSYGAVGALTPGSEARLTFSHGDKYGTPFHAESVAWAQDGIGIVYTYGPREFQSGERTTLHCVLSLDCVPVSRDPGDTCVAMLPPGGGSAYWQVCDTRPGHTDSLDVIRDPYVNRSGELFYSEVVSALVISVPRSERWQMNPFDKLSRRAVTQDEHSDNPPAPTVVLPAGTAGQVYAAHCTSLACIALSIVGQTGTVLPHWDLWRVDPGSGAATLLRSFDHSVIDAALSPTSGQVVLLEGDKNLYLLDLAVH